MKHREERARAASSALATQLERDWTRAEVEARRWWDTLKEMTQEGSWQTWLKDSKQLMAVTKKIVQRIAIMGGGAAAATGTAIWLVTTFGTASTGTAIAVLHGAALNAALLAALGGGSMAVGGIVITALGMGGAAGAIVLYRRWRGEPINVGDKIAMLLPGGLELLELVGEKLAQSAPDSERYHTLREALYWISDKAGLGTREALLAGAAVEDGWVCPYTGTVIEDASRVDIDHMVSWREVMDTFPQIADMPQEVQNAIYNDTANLEPVAEGWNAAKGDTPGGSGQKRSRRAQAGRRKMWRHCVRTTKRGAKRSSRSWKRSRRRTQQALNASAGGWSRWGWQESWAGARHRRTRTGNRNEGRINVSASATMARGEVQWRTPRCENERVGRTQRARKRMTDCAETDR